MHTNEFYLKTSRGYEDITVTWDATVQDYPEGKRWVVEIHELSCPDDDWPDVESQAMAKIEELRNEHNRRYPSPTRAAYY